MIIKTIQVGIVTFGAVYSNIIYINTDNDISRTISLIVACIYSLLVGKNVKYAINLGSEIYECNKVIKRINSDLKLDNSIMEPKVSLYKEPLEEKPKVNLKKKIKTF